MLRKLSIVFLITLLATACSIERGASQQGRARLAELNKVKARRYGVVTPTLRKTSCTILVNNQVQFDRINKSLSESIKRGERNIVVKILPGVYYYDGGHISRSNEKYDVNIVIEGNNATLIANGINYKDGDSCPKGLSVYSTVVDVNTLIPYSSWDDLRFSDKLIEVVNEKTKLCRIHHSALMDCSKEKCGGVYIHITEWYQSFRYKVEYIKGGWAYFTADNLAKSSISNKGEWNLNDDYLYAKTNPRFMLCNLQNGNGPVGIVNGKVKTATGSIHVCMVANFLMLDNVEYRSLTLKGLRFIGNSNDPSLIHLNKTNCGSLRITQCTFESLYSSLIKATLSNNIEFDGNTVNGCYTTALCLRNGCENVSVTNNLFENGSQCVSFSFFVQCEAKNFYIANNTFRDFGYSAIAAGMMRGTEKKYECSGIIENNEIYLTKDYYNNKEKYTSMDAGAIQVRTQSDQTIIRYNYIHDIVGMKDNRGIFCDEGARNFKIYNNVILNTPNCYSIDARKVTDRTLADTLNNRNNVMMYNVVDNRIRFVGRETGNNGCVKIGNVLLKNTASGTVRHQYGNLEVDEDDVVVNNEASAKEGDAILTPEILEELKKIPGLSKIKRIVKRR